MARAMGSGYPGFRPLEPGKRLFEKGVECLPKASPPSGGSIVGAGLSGPNSFAERGKRLWMLWRGPLHGRLKSCDFLSKLLFCGRRGVDSGENAERAEPRSAPALQVVRRHPFELVERVPDRGAEHTCRLVGIGVGTALRLLDDRIDDAELEAVQRVGLERGGRLLRLARIAPEDRRTTFRRDHRVDRVLLHQHAIRECDRRGAARPAFADDAGDDWNVELRHEAVRARERATLTVLLGSDTGIRPRRVNQRDDRKAVPVGELHHAHRLPIALRMGGPEVAIDAVLDVAPLLMTDERDRSSVEAPETRHDRVIVGAYAIAVELHPV